MPWMETCCVDQREQIVRDALREHWTMADLCRVYGISRKTGYKWLERYHAEGVAGLADRSALASCSRSRDRPHETTLGSGEAQGRTLPGGQCCRMPLRASRRRSDIKSHESHGNVPEGCDYQTWASLLVMRLVTCHA